MDIKQSFNTPFFDSLQLDSMIDKVGYPHYITQKEYRDEFYSEVSFG